MRFEARVMCSDMARANIRLRALRYLSFIDETHSLLSSPFGRNGPAVT
jgi:hypothetical protein